MINQLCADGLAREGETVVRATSERVNMGRAQETVPRALACDLDVVIAEKAGGSDA